MFESVAGWIVGLAGLTVALGILGKGVRTVFRTIKRVNALADQLLGDKEHNVPSLLDRVKIIEDSQIEIKEALEDHVHNHAPPAAPYQPRRRH